MNIRLAIDKPSSERNPHWIESCRECGIEYELVDCYHTDIISKLRSFDGLIWHFTHWLSTDLLIARYIIRTAEYMNLAVFPNIATCWHFDDKIAQKYVLEGIGAPLVPSYVFFEKEAALAWLETASFPLVRKLRRGAGSFNVGLVKNFEEGRAYCEQMFGEGICPAPAALADSRRRLRQMALSPRVFLRRVFRIFTFLGDTRARRRELPMERGYVFFQDFMPDNAFDVRIAVVGDRAWGFTRGVRSGDFRASGSGKIDYNRERIHPDCVKIAFDVSRALQSQSTAFDFVLNPSGKPVIVEISYGYEAPAVFNAPGHWSPDLTWHEGHTWPQAAIVSDLVAEIERRHRKAC